MSDDMRERMMEEGRVYRRQGLGVEKCPPYSVDDWADWWKSGWAEENQKAQAAEAEITAREVQGVAPGTVSGSETLAEVIEAVRRIQHDLQGAALALSAAEVSLETLRGHT
jgi:hypothetical protein